MFMEASVKQRLIAFLKFKQLSQARFSEIVGLSSGYVNAIRKSIQPETLHKIAMCFPDLNTGWLISGEGEMIKPDPSLNNGPGFIINGDARMSHSTINSTIDNRQYYSDSPDVLRAQIDMLDERIKEKDAQIKEKDAQIKQLLDIIAQR